MKQKIDQRGQPLLYGGSGSPNWIDRYMMPMPSKYGFFYQLLAAPRKTVLIYACRMYDLKGGNASISELFSHGTTKAKLILDEIGQGPILRRHGVVRGKAAMKLRKVLSGQNVEANDVYVGLGVRAQPMIRQS